MVEIQQLANGAVAMTVEGPHLEAGNVEQFRAAVEADCPPRVEEISVDLGAIEMIDSSGIGALLAVHKRLAESGGKLHLRDVRPPVVSVIELLRLHRVFDIQPAESAEAPAA